MDRVRHLDLAEPGAGPAAHPADVVGDLEQADRDGFEGPGGENHCVQAVLRLEVVFGFPQIDAELAGQQAGDLAGELRVGVDAGADGGAAEGDLGQTRLGGSDPVEAALELAGVAAEFLPQSDRHGVLQVRPAGLDDVVVFDRLGAQGVPQMFSAGSRGWVMAIWAARWITVGVTSLDDCPLLT